MTNIIPDGCSLSISKTPKNTKIYNTALTIFTAPPPKKSPLFVYRKMAKCRQLEDFESFNSPPQNRRDVTPILHP